MTLEILKVIISLCAINALEDTKGKWTELDKIEKYQKDCRVWYIRCYEGKNIGPPSDKIKQCIIERKI